jgi:Flp pilus assembly protein TadD
MPMLSRILLVAVAAVLVGLLARSLHHVDTCDSARRTVFSVAAGGAPASEQAPAVAKIEGNCRGATALISVAAVLYRQGRDADAQQLAQRAVDLEPDNATAWNALAATAAKRDPATAQRAARRQVELSPLDPPVVKLTAASTAGP